MGPTIKRRASVTSDPGGKSGGVLSLSAVANVVQVGLSKSFRRTGNAEKRSQSIRRIFRALVFAVIAIKRLQPRLNQSEVEQIKLLYDNAGGVHNVTQLVLLMQHAGIHGTDDVCRQALSQIGYKDGFLMTMEQFRHAFEHCKRDLLAMAKRNDDTLDAFTALGGGAASIDPETMANAIEEFGLTVDVQLIAKGGVAAAAAALSPASPMAPGATVSPVATSLIKPGSPAVVHKKFVTYEHFAKFFNSTGDDEENALPPLNTSGKLLAARGDGHIDDEWWTRAGDPDDTRWLETNSSAWCPPRSHTDIYISNLDRGSPLSVIERLESNLEFSETQASRASPHYLQTMKSFDSTSSSPSASRGKFSGDAQQRSMLPIHTVAASTSNVTSAREDSNSSSRTEGGAGIAGLLSERDGVGVTAEHVEAVTSGAAITIVVGSKGPPDIAQRVKSPANDSCTARFPADEKVQGKPVILAVACSPTRSEQHRPQSAVSQRSVSPSSWADFIERSRQDEVRRQQRIHSAPSERHARGKKSFYIAATLPGACLNPPPAPCYWREAKIEKLVLSSSKAAEPMIEAAPHRPPFVLRPTSACSAVSGSAARTVRHLQHQRPASASSSSKAINGQLPMSSFADDGGSSGPSRTELMSRWVSGGQLACGDVKSRRKLHRDATQPSRK
jgi:hypothetical protein